MADTQKIVPAAIAAGASMSAGVLLGDFSICGILFPAGWTPADVTAQISLDSGATWQNLNDETGTETKVLPVAAAVAGKFCSVDPFKFASLVFVRFRSGTSAAPVVQPSAVTLTIAGRRVYS